MGSFFKEKVFDGGLEYLVPAGGGFRFITFTENASEINYGIRNGREQVDWQIRKEEYYWLKKKLPDQPVALLRQIHGTEIISDEMFAAFVVNNEESTENLLPEGDALISLTGSCCLAIVTADCYPVFLWSPEGKKPYAAIHAGWRGTRDGIIPKTLHTLLSSTSANLSEIRAAILPGITADYYEVGEEFTSYFSEGIIRNRNKFFLDLRLIIIQQLCDAGLISENIYFSKLCTYRDKENLFSHRRGDKKRNLNLIIPPVKRNLL